MNIIRLNKFYDESGHLYVIDDLNKFLPKIKRFYFINFPLKNIKRGFHAHKNLSQIIFTIRGVLEIFIENKNYKKKIKINTGEGILINKCTWRVIESLENDSILGCLCTNTFDPNDYINSYKIFKSQL